MRNVNSFIALAALVGAATVSGQGMGTGPAGGTGFGGGPVQALAAPTGTVVVARPGGLDANGMPQGFDILAVDAAGDVLWTWTAPGRAFLATLFDDLVVVALGAGEAAGGATPSPLPCDPDTQLVALSLTTGSVSWELDLDARPTWFAAAAGSLYVTTVSGSAAQGSSATALGNGHGGSGSGWGNGGNGRGCASGGSGGTCTPQHDAQLLAISPTGQILWTVDLLPTN